MGFTRCAWPRRWTGCDLDSLAVVASRQTRANDSRHDDDTETPPAFVAILPLRAGDRIRRNMVARKLPASSVLAILI